MVSALHFVIPAARYVVCGVEFDLLTFFDYDCYFVFPHCTIFASHS